MTATSLDQLSGGRFLLGLGVSGPQVVEGWHGVPYGNPMLRTREYVEIVRAIWAREKPLEYHGKEYNIPYTGQGASGLGKPLKSIVHGRQIPIYIAAIGPKMWPFCGTSVMSPAPKTYRPAGIDCPAGMPCGRNAAVRFSSACT